MKILPSFQKGGALQDLNFERGVTGNKGVTFSREGKGVGLQFIQKKRKKLKSEIFYDS